MPIQIIDDFGTWDDLGTVQPVFERWLDFQDFTYSPSSLLRLFFNAQDYDRRSYGYIRCIYEVNTAFMVGRWVRIYPKASPEVIIYPHPEDLAGLKSTPRRIYQLMKRHRLRRYKGTFKSEPWALNLQVCSESDNKDNESEQLAAEFPTAYFLNLL